MKRVLLTGATGFIGRHAPVLLAERRFEVHAVSSRELPPGTEEWPPDVVIHRANLIDPDAAGALVRQVEPSHLLHLAWYTVHRKFWASPENLRWVEASLRLLRAFAEAGGQRAVFAGSCAEYDWTGDGLLSEATTRLEPATLYGASKHGLQAISSAFAAGVGMSFAWGRIFFVYGPREDPGRLVASVARALVAGEPAPCSHGEQLRDFLFAADVAAGFTALLDSDVEGAVNIGSGEPVAIKDLVAELGRAAGRPELVRLGALDTVPGEPALLVADARRLREEVGWRPQIPLAEGIARTVAWWSDRAAEAAPR